MTIAKKVAEAKTGTAPVVVAPPPVPAPSPFLSLSGSAEPANQSISVIEIPVVVEEPIVEPVVVEERVVEEPTPTASEEQCASPLAPASTTSSHTEESSE